MNVARALGKKWGPLPAWVWLGLFAVGMLLYRSYANKKSAAADGQPQTASGPPSDYLFVPTPQTAVRGSGGQSAPSTSTTLTPGQVSPVKPRPPHRDPDGQRFGGPNRRHRRPPSDAVPTPSPRPPAPRQPADPVPFGMDSSRERPQHTRGQRLGGARYSSPVAITGSPGVSVPPRPAPVSSPRQMPPTPSQPIREGRPRSVPEVDAEHAMRTPVMPAS